MSPSEARNAYNPTVLAQARKRYADLIVQAMMFDMDVDIETWTLMPKRKDEIPFWIKRWRSQQAERDYLDIDEQGWS